MLKSLGQSAVFAVYGDADTDGNCDGDGDGDRECDATLFAFLYFASRQRMITSLPIPGHFASLLVIKLQIMCVGITP